jgi:PhoPQ-activated pathogenicity-related protein
MTSSPRPWLAVLCATALACAAPARADLVEYVKTPDDAFSWKVAERENVNGVQVTTIDLVSQKWHDVTWDHKLVVYMPKDTKPARTMMLLNTGGTPNLRWQYIGLEIARQSGAPVAVLYGVPKQPLFDGKKEDALIAETFVRYLKTKDDSWPLLFPMVKSVVKAMDALQAFSKDEWKEPVKEFIISGGSKRGWTTWLTAATGDPRVKAIAPMVIDTLNMVEQMKHAQEVFGKPSLMVHDYVERGLIPLPDTDEARKLWRMVDPYSYRDKLTMPKLLLMGNNDPYWTTDALNLYWDDLKGPKWVTYIPNAGHDLQQEGKVGGGRALAALSGFTRHVVADNPMPKLSWKYDEADGKVRLTVDASPAPKGARLWVAKAPTRDFRESKWEERKAALGTDGTVTGEVEAPKEGCLAVYGDLDSEIGGVKFNLCTQIRLVGEPVKK